MVIQRFPPLEDADRSGLLAVGGDFEVESLLLAYSSGIFPWPIPDYPFAWFAPPKRAIIEFDNYRPSKSFQRWLRKSPYTITFDTAFADTMRACSAGHIKPDDDPESSVWITPQMIAAYSELHKAGFAHSCEIWDQHELVGGIYGISLGGMFAAESMFHKRDNASKLALHALITHLQKSGLTWIDVQVINPFTKTLGATEITRNRFMALLAAALDKPRIEFDK